MKAIRNLLNAIVFFTTCLSIVSCEKKFDVIPIYYNNGAGIRFGYSDGIVKFIDCVQIDDSMSMNDVWKAEYIFSSETLPINPKGDNYLLIGRKDNVKTSEADNDNKYVSKFDKIYNTSTRRTLTNFAIRAHFNNNIPSSIELTFRFVNENDYDFESDLFYMIRYGGGYFVYIWWVSNTEEEMQLTIDKYNAFVAEYGKKSFIPITLNVYMWNNYNPIDDPDEMILERKKSLYKNWQGTYYCFKSRIWEPEYYNVVMDFGITFDKSYPFEQ